jgi:GntR family histidine utilization transcriptional repressor
MELRNIADEIRARGRVHSARVELAETIIASEALAEEFEAPQSQRLFHVVMVHKENSIPVQLEDRYVNAAIVPDFLSQDFTRTTPTAYLIATVPVDDLEHTVAAVMPASDHQHLLDIGPGEPCLSLHRRSWSSGRVVTAATLLYPASRYALQSRHRMSVTAPIEGQG